MVYAKRIKLSRWNQHFLELCHFYALRLKEYRLKDRDSIIAAMTGSETVQSALNQQRKSEPDPSCDTFMHFLGLTKEQHLLQNCAAFRNLVLNVFRAQTIFQTI